MKTYGRPTPNAMCQNMMTFLSPYNPQDLPEILFKRCTDCQEVAIIANVKYSNEQLLMNVIDLLTRCGLYQFDLEDWDRKPDANKTWLNLRPFIQEAYQRCLALGTMTTGQGGYTSCNRFAPFQANNATDDNVLDNNSAETIAITINSHMANLSAQTAASFEANATQINTSLQQLATNNAQLHQQQQSLMQQMALLTTNTATTQNNAYVPPPAQIYALPPLHGFQQQSYYPPRGGGRGGGRSCGGRARRKRGSRGRGTQMPPLVPYAGMILYIPAGLHPPLQQQYPKYSNIVKTFSNQNVCYTCRFDVEDWHTSAMCNCKKPGHQDGFTCSNYMEYACANHPFLQECYAQNHVSQQLLMVWGSEYRC